MSLLRESAREAVDLARYQGRAFVIALAALLVVWMASMVIEPGPVTAILMLPPCVVILLTAFARVNDIGPEHMDWIWQVRRIGLVLAGAGAVMYGAAPWSGDIVVSWRAVILSYGVGLTWLTTPVLPPWWDYITGKYRETNTFHGHWTRFTGAGRRTGELDVGALKRRMRRGSGAGP